MAHDKNLIKIEQIPKFREWLEKTAGFEVRDGKGPFEMLQVKTGPSTWAVINRNTLDVLSSHPDLKPLIHRFKDGRATPAAKPETPADSFLDDLRDDIAMHALSGLLSNPHLLRTDPDTGNAIGPHTPTLAAREAYRFADEMLNARRLRS